MARLAAAGCVAPEEEAAELLAAAAGDQAELDRLVARRTHGEPLAWVVGSVVFCGLRVEGPPRCLRAPMADRGAGPPGGGAPPAGRYGGRPVHGCGRHRLRAAGGVPVGDRGGHRHRPGGGRVRPGQRRRRPGRRSRRVAADARSWARSTCSTAVVPYVPTEALAFLPRDVVAFEPRLALDGGDGGLRLLSAVVARSRRWLRPGGWLLLELGGDQASTVAAQMEAAGFGDIAVLRDDDGDDRAIEGRLAGREPTGSRRGRRRGRARRRPCSATRRAATRRRR